MTLVRVGKVGRPHSFKGAFVVQDHSGQDSVLGTAKSVWVGKAPDKAQEFSIENARWASQGWILKLKGADSDEWAKANVHNSLFLDRAAFPKADGGEYYVADLVGFEAIDAESGEKIGTFLGAESPGTGPDRWWFQVGGREVAVPAVDEYVEAVDTDKRQIRVRGLKDMP